MGGVTESGAKVEAERRASDLVTGRRASSGRLGVRAANSLPAERTGRAQAASAPSPTTAPTLLPPPLPPPRPSSHSAPSSGDAAEPWVSVLVPAQEDESGEDRLRAASFWGYHLAMALVCFYFAMLLTDWGVEAADASQRFNVCAHKAT